MDKRQEAIKLLTEERDGLNRAIAQLQGGGEPTATGARRRGRPRRIEAVTPARATAKTGGSAKATAKRRGRPRKAEAPEKARPRKAEAPEKAMHA